MNLKLVWPIYNQASIDADAHLKFDCKLHLCSRSRSIIHDTTSAHILANTCDDARVRACVRDMYLPFKIMDYKRFWQDKNKQLKNFFKKSNVYAIITSH